MEYMPNLHLRKAASGLALTTSILLLQSCSTGRQTIPGPAVSTPSPSWVVAWGASPENALPTSENPGGQEQSFRFLFLPTVAGTSERVHLSNLFGSTPVTVGSARLSLAIGGGPAIDPTHDVALTFAHGSPSVTLQPGEEIISDPVQIPYTFGQKMAVSLYLQGAFPALTQHDSQATINFATPSGAGDQTGDSTGAAFTRPNTEWYLLTGVDVFGDYQGTVAIFGQLLGRWSRLQFSVTPIRIRSRMCLWLGRTTIVPPTGLAAS